jgi:hypothetical protein
VGEAGLTPFKYSPLAASLFSLPVRFPEPIAASIWHLLNLGFLLASVWLCLTLSCAESAIKDAQRSWVPASALGTLGVLGVSPPVLHCLNSGQVGLAILFLFLLGVYFVGKRETETAGAFFFALSAMFKYLPVLILPYFIFKRRIRFTFFFAVWLIFFHLVPALWLGWSRNLADLKGFLPFLTSTTLDHISLLDFKNQSAWAYLYRLLYYDLGFFEIRNHPEWLTAAGFLFFCVLYTAILWRQPGTSRNTFVIDCALLGILILIFNPNAWKHNFVLLLFPYLILLVEAYQVQWKSWKTCVLAAVTLLLFATNRDFVGWNLRFESMSLSVLLLASLLLFLSLIMIKKRQAKIFH